MLKPEKALLPISSFAHSSGIWLFLLGVGLGVIAAFFLFQSSTACGVPQAHSSESGSIIPVFSPGAKSVILGLLDSAQESVEIEVYSFTSMDVVEKLVELKSRGVRVRVLLDKTLSGYELTVYRALKHGGISVRFVYMPSGNVMHSKIIIIDGKVLEIGSINFSEAALKGNREAGVIIRDSEVVSKYLEIFELDWQGSSDDYSTE